MMFRAKEHISDNYTHTHATPHSGWWATKRTEPKAESYGKLLWIFVLCKHMHTNTHALCQFDEVSFICYSWNNNKDINGKTIRLPMVIFSSFFLPPFISHSQHTNGECWSAHNLCLSVCFYHSVPFISFHFYSLRFFSYFSICYTRMIYFMPIQTHTHIANCLALKYRKLYSTYMYYITTTIRSGISQWLYPAPTFGGWRTCFEFSVSNADLLAFFSSLI